MNLFKYSDDKTFGFENDTDPYNFYNKKLASKCEYYTDTQFKNNISKTRGLSFIHFNVTSLKANLKQIRDYLAEVDLQFDIWDMGWTRPNQWLWQLQWLSHY